MVGVLLPGLALVLGARAAGAEVMRWEVDGMPRQAIVYAPDSATDQPTPLVLAFHGFGDMAQNFQRTDIHEAWPEAIVVYFQGLTTRRGMPGWQSATGDDNRDLKLVDVAVASLRESYRVDDARIYATGFSNGGMFTYLLWAERPDLFAAFAPVAARLRPTVQPSTPRPIFHAAGERDLVVDYADQLAAIDIAVKVNAVGDEPRSCGQGCTLYGPRSATPVMAWVYPDAHVWPRSTSRRLVDFFQEHGR